MWGTLRRAAPLAAVLAAGLSATAAAADGNGRGLLLTDGQITTFSLDSGGEAVSTAITGVTAGETLVGLDVRPMTGGVYALGVNATADTATLYALSVRTGVATPIGTPGQVAFVTTGGQAVDLKPTAYDLDFNPTVDRLRVVSATGDNFRVNPNTGAPIDGDPAAGTQMDGALNGAGVGASATAYTNSRQLASLTTQYTLDASASALRIQNPPNAGTQVTVATVTLGGAPLAFDTLAGLDIGPEVSTSTAGQPAPGRAWAVLTVGGTKGLYRIDLQSGAATLVAALSPAPGTLRGFAVQQEEVPGGAPAFTLDAAGGTLTRRNTATPAAASDIALATPLAGIDLRPATGQLLGVSIDAAADTGQLRLVDPALGTTTPIGGPFSFVTPAGAPVDLPADGIGFAVNPSADRVRVVTSTGLNFRVNPLNGAAIDGDVNAPGVNPDGALSGAATGAVATTYTNSFGQVAGGPTTQLSLDPVTDQLLVQNPPNSGMLSEGRPLRLGSVPLDTTGGAGLDLPPAVEVATAGAPPAGTGVAVLTVGGITGLYTVDLASGRVALAGGLPGPVRGLAVGGGPAPLPPVVDPPAGTPAPPAPPAGKPGVPAPGTGVPPAAAPPRVTLRPGKAVRRGRLTLTVTNPDTTATRVTVSARTVARLRPGGGKRGRPRQIALRGSTATVPARASRRLTLRVPSGLARALAGRRLALRVTLVLRAPDGRTATVTRRVTASLPRR